MPAEDTLADFAKLLKRLGAAVEDAVRSQVGGRWRDAYLDVRGSPDGASRTLKLRVNISKKNVASVKTTDEIDSTILHIFRTRDAAFSPTWYGLKLVLNKSGECDVTYNYDPHCEEDETFWDD